MLPSSSSHLARYGQINHYKKFWLLQTQLEKQEQTSSTALSLGVPAGSTNIKESKPLVSSSNASLVVGGDHLINNSNNTAGHGSCRGDHHTVPSTPSSSRAGAFPYCSLNEPSTLKLYNDRLGYTHMSNGSLRDSGSALSLAVNCDSGAQPINFLHQTWAPLSYDRTAGASELHLHNNSPSEGVRTHSPAYAPHISLVKGSSPGSEDCESSECSNSRGEIKRGGIVWESISSTSPSTSSFCTLPIKQRPHELARARGHIDPRSTNIPSSFQEATALPSSRCDHVCGSTGPLRTCTLCGTTKTPLWRSGPEGPKSLCNACGIRVKKTKRLQAAMEAAGEGAERIISSASSPAGAYKRLLAAAAAAATTCKGAGTAHKRKLSMEAAENQSEPIFQLKKKKKKAAGSRRIGCCSWPPPNIAGPDSGTCYRISGEASANLAVDSTTSKKFSNLFAKDVEEAAVLLMALSCGLVPA